MHEASPDPFVIDRACHFHPLFRVARHHVRRTDIDLRVRPGAEYEHSRVLQIPPHDTRHPQVLCPSRYPRQDTAYAAHEKVYAHPCPAGFRCLADKIHICHRIHFHDNASALSFCDLPVHQGEHFLLEACGRHDQMAVHPIQISDRHIFEKHRRIFPDLLVRCHKGVIRVHLRRFFIVIPRPDLGDIADLIFIPVCDQADLRVDLISLDPVDHAASCLLHPL